MKDCIKVLPYSCFPKYWIEVVYAHKHFIVKENRQYLTAAVATKPGNQFGDLILSRSLGMNPKVKGDLIVPACLSAPTYKL